MSNVSVKVGRFNPQSKVPEPTRDKAKENLVPNSSEDPKRIYSVDYKAIPYRFELDDRERIRCAAVKKERAERQSQFDNFDRLQKKQHEENLLKSRLNYVNKLKEADMSVLNEMAQMERQSLHDKELQKRKQTEKQEKLLKAQNWSQVQQYLENFNKVHESLINRYKTKDFNRILYNRFNVQVEELCKSRDQILKSIKDENHDITANHVTIARKLSEGIEQINCNYAAEYDEFVKRRAEENERQHQIQIQEQQAAQLRLEQQKAQDEADAKLQQTTVSFDTNSGFLQFVSKESFEFYSSLQLQLQSYAEIINPLLNDENLKKYRFDCQKAINIPVNAISAVNPQHLIDKYDKLSNLLSGNMVKAGDNTVSANSHPAGKQFCVFLLAKKFIQQADTQISSNPKAAFPVAAVIVALWQKYPEFGVLFLAHLHKECPYMVPYFMPQVEGQSTEHYLRLIGFHYIDGAVENQDLYLKRLSGIIRLYSAILITKPRQTFSNIPHPQNLEHGWRWLTNLLNLEPLPDICATLILEFLQITGSHFIKYYGKQFIKLLKFIHEKYFAKLNKIDEGGPKARLEGFLMKIFKDGIIQAPEGVLSDTFW